MIWVVCMRASESGRRYRWQKEQVQSMINGWEKGKDGENFKELEVSKTGGSELSNSQPFLRGQTQSDTR